MTTPATASASADTTLAGVPAPGPAFNFAQHLLALNTARADKAAFIDDLGSLSYGALATQVRQLASGLLGLGLRREERVLLLMHDCNDWPVGFLGAGVLQHVGVVVGGQQGVDGHGHRRAGQVRP